MSILTDSALVAYGDQFIKEITNFDGNQSAIDQDRFDRAANGAIGIFQMEVGVNFDETNLTHLEICIEGTIAMLEKYKSRDGNLMSSRYKNFLGAMLSMRKKEAFLPVSNSMLERSSPARKVRPDMDSSRLAFRGGRRKNRLEEIAE